MIKHCKECNKKFKTYPSAITNGRKYCSQDCYNQSKIGKPTWNKNIKGAGYKWMGNVIKNNLTCMVCGKEFHRKPYAIKRGRNKVCSHKCRVEWMKKIFSKDKNPSWMGGLSYFPYSVDWTKTLRKSIRERDGYKCRECGCPQEESIKKLHVHHIDYDKTNNNPINLITLCIKCHVKTNTNRDYWTPYFEGKVILYG